MAAEIEKVNISMNSLHVNDAAGAAAHQNGTEDTELMLEFPLEDLYKLAVTFYKGKQLINTGVYSTLLNAAFPLLFPSHC